MPTELLKQEPNVSKIDMSFGNEVVETDSVPLQFMFIFWGIIVPVIAAFGLIGNVLTMIVLFRRELESNLVYFLRMLAITDTLLIVGSILGISIISITQNKPEMTYYNYVIYPIMFMPIGYVVHTTQMMNVWVMVAIALDRYAAMCHPSWAMRIRTKRNANVAIGIIVMVSILYNIPRCFAVTHFECGHKESCYVVVPTEFGRSVHYQTVYVKVLYMVVIYIIPLTGICLCNTFVCIAIFRFMRRNAASTNQRRDDINVSIVLVLIIGVFILCQTPGLVAQFGFSDYAFLLKWICVSNTLFVLNSSVNFIIYTAVGKRFRKALFDVLRCRQREVNQQEEVDAVLLTTI